MLKFTSVSGSDFQATTVTDIPHMDTIIHPGTITGRTMGVITIGHTITAAIDITGTTIPTTITGVKARQRAKRGLLDLFCLTSLKLWRI
jgi:hypothetical protein